jgi:hypothetical protein
MSRFRLSFLLVLAVFFCARPVLATTFAVGTCKPSLSSYKSISAAVAAVPAGSIVLVCPGTYAEQVIINQPLTLQGVTSANTGQAIITAPAGGLTTTTSAIGSNMLSPQVEVTVGPVNISNLTVDGTGGSNNCASFLVGIFYYGSGSSGIVNEVTVRNEIDSACGFGIWAENATATPETVTIENSSIHDTDGVGIFADGNQASPSLTATIKGNYLTNVPLGLALSGTGVAGSAANNVIIGSSAACAVSGVCVGIQSQSPSTFISGNTITNMFTGIELDVAGISATSNRIANSSNAGVVLGVGGVTVKSNFIANSNAGIEFNCTTGSTVSGNTINEAPIGLNHVPLISNPTNTFFNVATLRNNSCGFAKSGASSVPSPLSPMKHHSN